MRGIFCAERRIIRIREEQSTKDVVVRACRISPSVHVEGRPRRFPPRRGCPFFSSQGNAWSKSRLPDMHSPFERRIVETRKLARLFSMGAQRHECRLLAVRPPPQAEKLNVEVSVEEHRYLRQYHSTTRVRRSVRSPPDSAGRRITSESFAKLQH